MILSAPTMVIPAARLPTFHLPSYNIIISHDFSTLEGTAREIEDAFTPHIIKAVNFSPVTYHQHWVNDAVLQSFIGTLLDSLQPSLPTGLDSFLDGSTLEDSTPFSEKTQHPVNDRLFFLPSSATNKTDTKQCAMALAEDAFVPLSFLKSLRL